MVDKIYINPNKTFLALHGSEWRLHIIRVLIENDNKQMILIKPVKAYYNRDTQKFDFEDLQKPIWLSLEQANDFWRKLGVIIAESKMEIESA